MATQFFQCCLGNHHPFLIICSWHLCQWTVGHKRTGLLRSSLVCSASLEIYFMLVPWWFYPCFLVNFEIRLSDTCSFSHLIKMFLVICALLESQTVFRVVFPVSVEASQLSMPSEVMNLRGAFPTPSLRHSSLLSTHSSLLPQVSITLISHQRHLL